jgi:hypothetical protein
MTDDNGKQGSGGTDAGGMSKEEWLRQNPGQAFDPVGEEIDEGMTKEEYLRKTEGGGDQPGSK